MENHQKCVISHFFSPLTFADAGDGDGGDHFLFNTKIQISTAAAVEFGILLSTMISLIAKSQIINSAAPAAELRFLNFAKYHYLITSKIQNSKIDCDSGRILKLEFC